MKIFLKNLSLIKKDLIKPLPNTSSNIPESFRYKKLLKNLFLPWFDINLVKGLEAICSLSFHEILIWWNILWMIGDALIISHLKHLHTMYMFICNNMQYCFSIMLLIGIQFVISMQFWCEILCDGVRQYRLEEDSWSFREDRFGGDSSVKKWGYLCWQDCNGWIGFWVCALFISSTIVLHSLFPSLDKVCFWIFLVMMYCPKWLNRVLSSFS